MNGATDAREIRVLEECGRVLELPVAERLRYVREHFAAEPDLARELERLLAAAEDAERGLLGSTADGLLQPVLADLEAEISAAQTGLISELAAALAPRYVVEEELGRGGAARVFLAFDKSMNRFVALKVLRPELSDGLTRERFELEIEITAKLNHARIVPVYDRNEAAGLMYYIMRYADGGPLRERLLHSSREPQRLEIGEAITIARQVGEALDYAHGRGVIHRDIKPENILLDEGGAYVADFGVARLLDAAGRDHLTRTGIAVGTAHYMSPEQIESSRTVDARSDVYALACVVFEMLAGEPPFTGPTRGGILSKHLFAAIPDLSVVRRTVTPSMQEVMKKALSKTAADRYKTATEFVDAFDHAYRSGDLTKRSQDHAAVRPWWRRPRLLVGVAAAASAILSGYLIWRVNRPAVETLSSSPAAPAADRIAVLYFEDLSGDRQLGHIAAGLTEDLIDQLSQAPLLKVVSSNGVRVFRDSTVPVDTIRERFGVGTIIGGSVSSSGGMLRVNVRLIDAASGNQVNSLSVRQPLLNLFNIQDTIMGDVAFWLRERIGRQFRVRAPAPARSAAAWELVQRGEEVSHTASLRVLRGDTSAIALFTTADSLFQAAANLDRDWETPGVARARTALGRAFAYPDGSEHEQRFVASLRTSVTLADGVLRAHPEAAAARAVRGETYLRLATLSRAAPHDSLLTLAANDLEAAVRMRPDQARSWYALAEVRRRRGQHAGAIEAYRSAYEHDPFLAETRSILGSMFFSMLAAGQYQQASEWCGISQRRFAGDPRFLDCALHVVGWTGQTLSAVDSAWRLLEVSERSSPQDMNSQLWSWRRTLVAAVVARAGMRDSARAILRRVESERGERPGAEVPLAYVHLLLGEREQAIDVLKQYLSASPAGAHSVAIHPWFRTLAEEPRFRALVTK